MKGPHIDVVSHLGALRRYARSLVRDESQAEDLVHDALVQAYRGRETFKSGGNLRGWLLSIVHNVFVDGLRARRAETARIEEAGYLAETAEHAPQEHAARLTQVQNAFFALPDEQRAVLHLVAIEGLSYREAADSLGIPIGTVISRLSRARSALREMEEASPRPARLRIVGGRDEPNR